MEQLLSTEYIVSILLSGISLGGQLALIAIGYTMVYGILRLINFAHGDVFMVAGLLGIYISAALPMYVAIPIARSIPVNREPRALGRVTATRQPNRGLFSAHWNSSA